MKQLLRTHPLPVLGGLLVLAFVLFMLSGIPVLKDAQHGWYLVLGDICWFGFLLSALAFVVGGVYTFVHRARRPRSAL